MKILGTFICNVCNCEKDITSEFKTNYIHTPDGEKICFDCCGAIEADELYNLDYGKTMCLYVKHIDKKNAIVTNWPETLKIPVAAYSLGQYNFVGRRIDYWFKYRGNTYKGKRVGDNNIIHVKRIPHIPSFLN